MIPALNYFKLPRDIALEQCVAEVEAMLLKENYLTDPDFATLQAFVVYLAMLRSFDYSKKPWTQFALVVRSGHALGLHIHKTQFSLFEHQERSRLWHAIRVLDLQLAIDRACDPLIAPSSLNVPIPKMMDDEDLSPDMIDFSNTDSSDLTHMTFSLMMQDITTFAQRAHHAHKSTSRARLRIIRQLKSLLQGQYLSKLNMDEPFHCFVRDVARSSIATLSLHSLWPTSAVLLAASQTPVDFEETRSLAFDALMFAKVCYDSASRMNWTWVLWSQWHAMVIALVILNLTPKEKVAADQLWLLVDSLISDDHHIAVNVKEGHLGKHVSLLHENIRQTLIEDRQTSSSAKDGIVLSYENSVPANTDDSNFWLYVDEMIDMLEAPV